MIHYHREMRLSFGRIKPINRTLIHSSNKYLLLPTNTEESILGKTYTGHLSWNFCSRAEKSKKKEKVNSKLHDWYEGDRQRATVGTKYREPALYRVVRVGLSEERPVPWDMREAKGLPEQRPEGREFLVSMPWSGQTLGRRRCWKESSKAGLCGTYWECLGSRW